jgi:mono/diheme cytochrome c family protein
VVAEFTDADALLAAGEAARNAGYRRLDAYTPFPIHGMERALGIRRSRLPFFVLAVGLTGCAFGIFFQWYANAAVKSPVWPGYDYMISGKPYWSLPANVPIIFEVTVLTSAFAAFLGMLFLNRLPRLANPLHRIARFHRATNDRFFLWVDAGEAGFDERRISDQLRQWGASAVDAVHEDLTDHRVPSVIKAAAVLFLCLLLVPPVLVYRARGMTSRDTRLHFVPDMDFQVRFKSQRVGPDMREPGSAEPDYLFPDIRAARPRIAGTIARGQLEDDIEFYHGIKASSPLAQTDRTAPALAVSPPDALRSVLTVGQTDAATPQEDTPPAQAAQPAAAPEPDWVTEFPEGVDVSLATAERGKHLFEINCVACHGYSGNGDGLVNRRALELNVVPGGAAWTTAKSLHDEKTRNQPVGRIFDTITNGRATMGPYGGRISAADRWAIVLYVKALQEVRPEVPSPPEPTAEPAPASDSSGQPAASGAAMQRSGEAGVEPATS